MNNNLLGQETRYDDKYNPKLLFPIPRKIHRDEIDVNHLELPFNGKDVWNIYEASWLNMKGKPVVGVFQIEFNINSEFIIESKSMKLYFNSFNGSKFENVEKVLEVVKNDFENLVKSEVSIKFENVKDFEGVLIHGPKGINIDDLDVEIDCYEPNSDLLKCDLNEIQEEKISSNLLKSNCLVTNQPDWASVEIYYDGPKIDHASMLKYLVSFRNHNEFHEQCVERMFVDIMRVCKPRKLSVYARYTRRGGIDINPYRSNFSENMIENNRFARQ